ncbi:MAG: site-specific DNA-methyltransferase [Clostridiales bacterium]|nr:site-specific DNA-methyltransferase [Clostridiales bacterium]
MKLSLNFIYEGDSLSILKNFPDNCIDCCVTSPPYWNLRNYGNVGQIGLEDTIDEYVENIKNIFSEVKRVLKNEGVLFLNLGDTYIGGGRGGDSKRNLKKGRAKYPQSNKTELPIKSLAGIPWRVAFALQDDGWILRQDIIWRKPNAMPEPVKDRCVREHEYIFLFAKSRKYYFRTDLLREKVAYDGRRKIETHRFRKREGKEVFPGSATKAVIRDGNRRWVYKNDKGEWLRNKRSVWDINTQPLKDAHFAAFPEELVRTCLIAGCPEGGIVLDPFMGSGTTGIAAIKMGRKFVGVEVNPDYIKIAQKRIKNDCGLFIDGTR